MAFAPLAPTVGPNRTRSRPTPGSSTRSGGARRAALRLPELDGDPGEEPMIVDTGTPANREQWLEDVFGLVEPEDVRWVFLSHDDVDHTGNLDSVMERCPNATLVSAGPSPSGTRTRSTSRSTAAVGSTTARRSRPATARSSRCARRSATRRPPAASSTSRPACTGPSTRSRARCRAVLETAADFDQEHLAQRHGDVHVPRAVAVVVDCRPEALCGVGTKEPLAQHVDDCHAHSPVIPSHKIDEAYDLILEMPSIAPPPCPDHSVLQAVLGG